MNYLFVSVVFALAATLNADDDNGWIDGYGIDKAQLVKEVKCIIDTTSTYEEEGQPYCKAHSACLQKLPEKVQTDTQSCHAKAVKKPTEGVCFWNEQSLQVSSKAPNDIITCALSFTYTFSDDEKPKVEAFAKCVLDNTAKYCKQ